MSHDMNIAKRLASPDWFLNRFHAETRRFSFIKTSQALLHDAAFHDGRSNLKLTAVITEIDLEDALTTPHKQKDILTPLRIIAHTSFCGSTLLARILDIPKSVVSYREPQALTDLAQWRMTEKPHLSEPQRWSETLKFVLGQYQKTWLPTQTSLIKPANWANPLLLDMRQLGRPIKIICMTMSVQNYILANLRGGTDRIKFTLDLLNYLSTGHPDIQDQIAKVNGSNLSQIAKALHLMALCHAAQIKTLKTVDEASGTDCYWVMKEDVIKHPFDITRAVSAHLDLPIRDKDRDASVAVTLQYNSKIDNAVTFDSQMEAKANDTILKNYRSDIDRARDWYEKTFGSLGRKANLFQSSKKLA